MKLRKMLGAAIVAALVGCSTPVNPTLLQDGQIAVEALQALDAAVSFVPGVPASAVILAGDVLAAAQQALTSLQNGATTAAAFGTALSADIGKLQPIATDLKANQTITTGIALLQRLVPTITADIANTPAPAPAPVTGTPATAQAAPDVRGQLKAWAASVKQ